MTVLSKTKSCLKPAPFKTYAAFEPIFKIVKSNDRFYSKKISKWQPS